MKTTYYITGVQLGILYHIDEKSRKKILDEISDNQQIDNNCRNSIKNEQDIK